jgi:hypothetical protein
MIQHSARGIRVRRARLQAPREEGVRAVIAHERWAREHPAEASEKPNADSEEAPAAEPPETEL